MLEVCVLASGRGTDLEAIIEACEAGRVTHARVGLVICNVKGAMALERACRHGISAVCIPHVGLSRREHESRVARRINDGGIGLVVLAGYMRILSPHFFEVCSVPVINIHPSLLPLFGGRGWYGERVHRAVIESGVRYTGCTVHFVTPEVDAGPIILQKVVPVYPGDSWESVAERVLRLEHRLLPLVVELIANGRVHLVNGKVEIDRYEEIEKEISAW